MTRSFALAILLTIGIVAVVLFSPHSSPITISDAKAYRIDPTNNVYAIELTINNAGNADVLRTVHTPDADHTHIMNIGYKESLLTLPAEAQGLLAMDGAHIMTTVPDNTLAVGALLPIRLTFDKAGEVSTQARIIESATMDHGAANAVKEDPAPSIDIVWTQAPSKTGLAITIATDNFTFLNDPDITTHIANHGHAHIYLNGLKLGRTYTPDWQTGALPSGDYELKVSLNSNDHRPFLSTDGAIVAETLRFTIE